MREGDIVVTRVGRHYALGRVKADGETQTRIAPTRSAEPACWLVRNIAYSFWKVLDPASLANSTAQNFQSYHRAKGAQSNSNVRESSTNLGGRSCGFGFERRCRDRGSNLLQIFALPHHFQGVRILPQDFIQPILVGGREDHASPLHRVGVTHRLKELPILIVRR